MNAILLNKFFFNAITKYSLRYCTIQMFPNYKILQINHKRLNVINCNRCIMEPGSQTEAERDLLLVL